MAGEELVLYYDADRCIDNNIGAGPLTPLGLFFIIFGIGACFGWETGYAINLARDFGPRLMSYFLGYGHEVWSAGNYYFWVSKPSSQFYQSKPSDRSRSGTHDSSVLWLHIRRFLVRPFSVHRRVTAERAVLGHFCVDSWHAASERDAS